MEAKYQFESLHKIDGVTKFYQVDKYIVTKNGDRLRIINTFDTDENLMAEIREAIERCGE